MNLKRKIYIIVLNILIALLLVGCGSKDNTIYFKKDLVLEYGSNDSPLVLIERIGNTEVTKQMIKDGKLTCGNIVVECEDVDTSSLGNYDITYTTSDSTQRVIAKTISVADTKAPIISLKGVDKDNSLTMTASQFKNYNFANNIDVKDNYDEHPETTVAVDDVKGKNEYNVVVTSTDKFNNSSTKTFVVKIKEEKKEESKSKEEIKQQDEKKSNSTSSSNSSQSSSSNSNKSSSNNSTDNNQGQSSSASNQKKGSETFYFGNTYTLNGQSVECNMDNVYEICTSRLSGSGECIPLKDSNGIYIGMQLNYY